MHLKNATKSELDVFWVSPVVFEDTDVTFLCVDLATFFKYYCCWYYVTLFQS